MNELEKHANNVRKNVVKMIHNSQSGHPGGALSSTDIMIALYFNVMNINKENLKDQKRDKFILSKGHASAGLYAVLAEKGLLDESELMTFRLINSNLQGHPNMNEVAGVDMTTGSLGQGLSAAVGMSIANKLDGNDFRTYVICGDGELQEGQIWEAAMSAAHYKLDNLLLFVDHNGLQIDGKNTDVMNVNPIEDKFKAFGWNVYSCDGHNIAEITKYAKLAQQFKNQPSVIVCQTVKGKGVSFMENQAGWHGKAPNDEQLQQALDDLGGQQ